MLLDIRPWGPDNRERRLTTATHDDRLLLGQYEQGGEDLDPETWYDNSNPLILSLSLTSAHRFLYSRAFSTWRIFSSQGLTNLQTFSCFSFFFNHLGESLFSKYIAAC